MHAGLGDYPVHVVSGEVAAAALRSFLGRQLPLFIQRDPLYAGPISDFSDPTAFRALRSRYLSSLAEGLGEATFGQPDELMHDPRRVFCGSSLTVWAGEGLEDTLLVLLVVHLARALGARGEQLRLVRFPARAGRGAPRHAVGQIRPEFVARGHPPPRPIDEELASRFESGWRAFSSASPRDLEAYLSDAAAEPALRLLLQRYPQAGTGLSAWESALLDPLQRRGRTAARLVAGVLAAGTPGDAMRDLLLFDTLRELSGERAARPLVTLSGPPGDIRDRLVRLTDVGRAVLRGELSALSCNALDRWVGGVNISSAKGLLWLRDGDRLVQAR